MTSPRSDRPTPPPDSAGPGQPKYADRAYRSVAGMVGGVGLVAVACWLGGDAIANGKGHTPWLAIAALLLALPLIVALTLRPAVFANSDRIRVRNPFRTITVPWAGVDGVRSSYSTEMLAGGKKYQLWAIPVSLRARKRAARQEAKVKAAGDDAFTPGGGGRRPAYGRRSSPVPGADPTIRAWSDQALSELRELAERHEGKVAEGGSTVPVVRWCWEVLAPAAAGAVVLIVLLSLS
ncbi:PH domain-containing protein [Streptomyces sp. IBSBF 2435]|uniref:PH domain-containing protein n=1 Tax=Streptomyces sp. IBSBF 2435 TaxID=2903531 RepID=UPI002FDC3828